MKKILIAATAAMVISSSVMANVNITNNGTATTNFDTFNINAILAGVKNSNVEITPAIHLANLTTSGLDTCLGSSTVGISGAGFGVSGGQTEIDQNCVRMKNAKLLIKLGLTDAAIALIALDPDVAEALELAYPDLHYRLVR